MIDRRAGPAALLCLAAIVAGCLPGAVAPDGSGGPGSGPAGATQASTPSPLPSGPSPSPSFVRPTPTPMPTFLVYVVKKGDSLNTIAHQFGTKARSIAFWNRARYPSLDPESSQYRPDIVQPGWTLDLIPGLIFDENSLPEPTDTPAPTDPPEPTDPPAPTASL